MHTSVFTQNTVHPSRCLSRIPFICHVACPEHLLSVTLLVQNAVHPSRCLSRIPFICHVACPEYLLSVTLLVQNAVHPSRCLSSCKLALKFERFWIVAYKLQSIPDRLMIFFKAVCDRRRCQHSSMRDLELFPFLSQGDHCSSHMFIASVFSLSFCSRQHRSAWKGPYALPPPPPPLPHLSAVSPRLPSKQCQCLSG